MKATECEAMIPTTTIFRHAARGAISAALATVLACASALSGADESSPAAADGSADAPAQGEFMEFLEYLGSWNGQEDQWQQFLSDSGEPILPEALMVDADPPADAASLNLP
jgi:hypothetical protein